MTDPEHMTADELEALVGEATRMSRYPRYLEVARLVLVAPVLALRLARLLRAVEEVLAEWVDPEEFGWCDLCEYDIGANNPRHDDSCPIPVLRAAMGVEANESESRTAERPDSTS